MATFLEDRNRIVIPRWREYKKNNISAEHLPAPLNIVSRDFNNDPFLIEKINSWNEGKNISTALELVNSTYALGLNSIAFDAARFLKDQHSDLPRHVLQIVCEILGEPILENTVSTFQDEKLETLFKYIGSKLHVLRNRLIDYPNNPLLWLEMGRLHSILGNAKKAEKSIVISLELSKGLNRYITRAASRFFYHIDEYDRAHSIIKKSPFVKIDPWLMASEISYATKQKKFSPNIKKGMEAIASSNFSNESISELSSMIGTIELYNGSFNSARKLTNKSLLAPNDNSLAQAEWISRHISNIGFDPWLEKIEYAYEARAHEFLAQKQFKKSLEEGFNWVIDQPFSKRAVEFSSYLACGLLDDFDNAIQICKFGLRTNPNSFEILNNLAFSLASKNEVISAKIYLDKMASLIENDHDRIIFSATDGLIDYRSNRPNSGKEKYLKAIALAKKIKEGSLASVAEINFTREQLLANEIKNENAIEMLTNLLSINNNSDLVEVIESTINKIRKMNTTVLI